MTTAGRSRRALLVETALRAGHTARLTATGTSMRPLIPSGAQLTVEPVIANDLVVGDVAVALFEDRLVAHRVARVSPIELRGDSSTAVEKAPEILGRVVAVCVGGVAVRIDGGWGKYWSRVCARLGPWVRRAATF